MSQKQKVQKLQSGDAITKKSTSPLRVRHNGELIDLDEGLFAKQYEQFLGGGGGKTKNRGDWDQSYNSVLDNIRKGAESGNYYDFTLGDGRATKISYSGDDLTNDQRGLNDGGKSAKIGLLSGITGERNDAARVSSINEILGQTVAGGIAFRNKEIETANATTKAEEAKKAEELKLKTQADKARSDSRFLNTFDFNKSFMGESIDGTPMAWGQMYSQYHKDPSKQDQLNKDYLTRLQGAVTGDYFNSEEGRSTFASKYNIDPDKLKSSLTGLNLNGKVNYENIYKNIGMLSPYSQLSDRSTYDKQLALELEEKNRANGIVPKTPEQLAQEQAAEAEQASLQREEMLKQDLNFGDANWTNFRDKTVNIMGVPTKFQDYLTKIGDPNYIGTDEEKAYAEQLVNPRLAQFKADGFKEGLGWKDIQDASIWSGGKDYNYNPYRALGNSYSAAADLQDVEQYKDITGTFSNMAGNLNKGIGGEGTRDMAIIQEAVKDPVTGVPKNRYRMISKGRLHKEIDIKQDASGNYKMYIYSDKARTKPAFTVNLGKQTSYDPNSKSNPFIYQAGTNKGVIGGAVEAGASLRNFLGNTANSLYNLAPSAKKHQEGGTIDKNVGIKFGSNTNNDGLAFSQGLGSNKRTISVNERMFDKGIENTEADNYEVGALMADIAGLGASFVPGGGVVTGVAGIGSSLAHAKANSLRGEDWGGELAVNLGMDVLTALPTIGGVAKAVKIGKNVKRILPWMKSAAGMAMLGSGGKDILQAAIAVSDGDYSTENMRVLVGGLTSALAGKRMSFDSKLATKPGAIKNKVNLDVDGNKVDFDLNAKDVSALEGKNLAAQRTYISELYKAKNPNAQEVVADALTSRKGWKLKKVETDVDIKSTQGKELKDYDTANWFEKRAIKRQVKMNPGLNPSTYDGQGKFDTNAVTYSGMGNHKDKVLTDKGRLLSTDGGAGAVEAPPKPIVQAKGYGEAKQDVTTVDSREVKTRPTTTSREGDTQTAEDLRVTKRDDNLAKGRMSGPKTHSAKLKEVIAKDKQRKTMLNKVEPDVYAEGTTDVTASGPSTSYMSDKFSEIRPKNKEAAAKVSATSNVVAQTANKPKEATKNKETFSEAEIRNIRKSLGFKTNAEADLDLSAVLSPGNKREKQISKKILTRAQNDKKFANWLDSKLDDYQTKSKTTENINTGKIKLQEGGVIKAQTGLKFPKVIKPLVSPSFVRPEQTVSASNGLGDFNLQIPNSIPKAPALFGTGRTIANPLEANPVDILGKPMIDPNFKLQSKNFNLGDPDPYKITQIEGTTGTTPVKKGIAYDPIAISELGRALANRRAHGRLDTRSEAAIATAPTQVSPTVRGDLLSRSGYDTAASRLEQQATTAISSDASLNLAGRLNANAKANDYRAQGAMANASAVRQQEQMLLQSDQQAASQRAQIANANQASIANKNQAERVGRNTKDASMFKSLDNYWAASSGRAYGERARLQGIQDQANAYDTMSEKFGPGTAYAGKTASEARASLLTELNNANTELASATDDITRANIRKRIEEINARGLDLADMVTKRGFQAQLNAPLYGEKKVYLPNIFGNRNNTLGVTSNAKGGKLTLADKLAIEDTKARNKARAEWAKDYRDFFKNKANNDAKENATAQRIAADFSKAALKKS